MPDSDADEANLKDADEADLKLDEGDLDVPPPDILIYDHEFTLLEFSGKKMITFGRLDSNDITI